MLQEVGRLAFVDPRKFYREDGTLKTPMELDDNTAAALASIEVFEEFSGHGKNRALAGYLRKIKWADKGQNHGNDSRSLTGTDDKPGRYAAPSGR